MPKPHLRTRSKKRVKVAIPGGKNRIHYKTKVTASPSCSICGNSLAGIPHLSTVKERKLNRSRRRVWRSYGRQLCHSCLKEALKQGARTL